MRFPLGRVVMTRGVQELVAIPEIIRFVTRHSMGDWGDVDGHDKRENDRALKVGNRVLSSYTTLGGIHIWIITEADRSYTTVLLPSEY